ncbi:MAG: HAD-IIA family hydrolase [Elusimicrobiota bacterium]|jgi:4-nitrophenyl phosphatase|nr:HAD-IIA family hydrolase [Elusimicrobiota bacterium]
MLKNAKCIVIDLDGTIYFGSQPAPRAADFIAFCRGKFKRVFFATNNSAKTLTQLRKKLADMGICVKSEEIINSGLLVADFLSARGIKDIYCFGTEDFKQDLLARGLNPLADKPEAIVVGYDPDFNIPKLERALNIALKNSCRIIAANVDRAYPRDNGIISPGAGAIVKALEYSLNRRTAEVIGKPNVYMLEYVAKKSGLKPWQILMLGDNFESDIKMAGDFGALSILLSTRVRKGVRSAKNLTEVMEILNEN